MKDSNPLSQFRRANFEDVVFIARLIREFYANQGNVYQIPYDHESALITIDDTIRRGVCLVGETSCAGALMCPFPFNCEAVIAHVVFWYFKKPSEIRILSALSQVCKAEHGATHLNTAGQFPKNTIGRYYEKNGMYASEVQYLGNLESCCKPADKSVIAKI